MVQVVLRLIQWESEIRPSLDFEWSKTGWVEFSPQNCNIVRNSEQWGFELWKHLNSELLLVLCSNNWLFRYPIHGTILIMNK